MVSDSGPGREESRTTYFLEVERERDGVRFWTRMRREQDNVPPGGGEGAGWCQIVDLDVRRAGQRTPWRWRGSVMVSDSGPGCEGSTLCTPWRWRGSVMVSDCEHGCEESRTTYSLEVERERDGVRLWTRTRRE